MKRWKRGPACPFTGGKRMVDVEKLQEILDEIRLNLPTELRQAKAIVNDRADIENSARKEADGMCAQGRGTPASW